MSYRRVSDEIDQVLAQIYKTRGGPSQSDSLLSRELEAERIVIERYIKERDLDPLVDFAVANFDSVTGDELIWPISNALVQANQIVGLHRLWTSVTAHRRLASGPPKPAGDPTITPRQERARRALALAGHQFAAALRLLDQHTEAARVELDIDRFLRGADQKRPARDRRPMTEDVFWDLIGSATVEADAIQRIERIIGQLERFTGKKIIAFQKLLDQQLAEAYRHDLWAVAHIIRRGCGDDEFDYFRAWLVLQGRGAFQAALSEPDLIGDLIGDTDPQAEQLLSASSLAYAHSTGKPMPRLPAIDLQDLAGTPWQEDDLPEMFPMLWQQFR